MLTHSTRSVTAERAQRIFHIERLFDSVLNQHGADDKEADPPLIQKSLVLSLIRCAYSADGGLDSPKSDSCLVRAEAFAIQHGP